MENKLTTLSPQKVAAAPKANLYALFRQFKNSTVAEVAEDRYILRWHTLVPHGWFNGALSLRKPRKNEKVHIASTLDYLRDLHTTSCSWWFETHVQPIWWANYLDSLGFIYTDDTPGMAVELSSLPRTTHHPNQLIVRPVTDLDMLAEWSQTFVRGYGIPTGWEQPFYDLMASMGLEIPFRHYIAYLYGKAVATSTLFLGAGVAGIYNVATMNEARGQGIGAYMTLLPLQQVQALGYRLGVLQSSEMGFRTYQRLGFTTVCQMDHYYLEIS